MQFETIIGLEVHAQLKTRTKIFCGCSTQFGGPPNTHTCPVCLGMPGVLPVLNRQVVEYTLRMALATHCTIARESRFARKNYFYPDLPKGYQISQYELPIAEHGHLDIAVESDSKNESDPDAEPTKRIGITRIHMEEDAGKLIHDDRRPVSRVDLNRTGVPLMEIVSEPDMRSPAEAGAYLRKLRSIIRYLGIGDGNMEEGSFRCDANVSIRPVGSDRFGTRTEIKNLNSFKNVEKAIRYEVARQREILLDGASVIQETRLWDPAAGRTNAMRGKEEAHDYRYFPDPDLVPLVIDEAWIAAARQALPELPDDKRARFIDQHGLPAYDAGVLTASRDLADYYEETVKRCQLPKPASNWIMGSLLGLLNAEGLTIAASPISPHNLADLLTLIDRGTISGKIAKTVFEEMAVSGNSPQEIVAAKGLEQVSDTDAIAAIVDQVWADHPDEVARLKAGNQKLMGFFVGQVMRSTKGKANPKIVNQLLAQKLAQ
ncbi:MAG: Asp-tRNA(Asn)/Glu-tRNA(Gln) amidotransferase subunit GatB [Desulfosarcinaceae bacterium]|nr:Asp-tRNA(Asn)/Glu-tRNA(Gln) amidotransferase subunit GatB [Desulfosarcinaceae bacterium]